MPREFYPDTDQSSNADPEKYCLDEITLFDGPGICMRRKNHKVDEIMNPGVHGEFHQEAFEGWVWTNNGRVG